MTFQVVDPGKRLLDGDAINALANMTNFATLSPLTALAGGGRTGATQLIPGLNRIGTCATSADSVILPSATLANGQGGLTCSVANDGATDCTVYAQGSDTINGTAGATGITLTTGTSATFFVAQTGKWNGNTTGSGTFTTITATTGNITTVNSTTDNATAVNVGASGTAGTLSVFPTTVSKGKTTLTVADNSTNTTTAIAVAAQAAARTYTVPDNGASSSFLLTQSTLSTTTGLSSTRLPFMSFKNADGTTLAASAASGKFGLAFTAGTSLILLTEAANNNTKTDTCSAEIVLPPWYRAATDITVTANTNYTLGTGTVGTHTLAAAAYLNAAAGTEGSTLIATAAQTVAASAGNVTFTITGATLVPGSYLTLTFTLAIQETASGGNITAQINSVALS